MLGKLRGTDLLGVVMATAHDFMARVEHSMILLVKADLATFFNIRVTVKRLKTVSGS